MMGYGTMGLGWLFWILIIAAIAWLVTYVARRKGPGTSDHEGEAVKILKQRFARGEIGQEEFQEKRKILSH
jgi:putative membrane protein